MRYEAHLSSKDFERLLHNRADRETVKAAHHHLLRCRRCRIYLFVYDEALAGLHLDEFYGAGTAEHWRRQLEDPVDTLSYMTSRGLEIGDLEARAIRLHAVNTLAFQDVGSLAAVVARGHSLRKDNPTEAKVLLEGAVQALEARDDWPGRERSDLLARAFTYLGNIHRILYEFSEARSAFDQAHSHLRNAQPAPESSGELAWMEGFLHVDQRDYETGLTMLRAASAQLGIAHPRKALEVEISLAITYFQAGQKNKCVATLEALVEKFPAAAFPPGAFLASLQSLAVGYAETGQPERAKALLPKVQGLAKEEGNRLDLVRVQWLEAKIYKAEGKRTLAAAEFRDVTSKFLAAKIPVDAALATLSQAEMYLDLGDTRAAAELAEVLVPIFRSKGIDREATAAGLIVVEDLRREAATAGQVQELVERLQGVGARRPPSHTS